ncbi:LD-carboxypeptidase [Pseudomonas sp. DTU_2021_1001937_2_SI_NGA_ILE_001]|uniref:S66 peptidase family protein n=1 Tax=Pseudomonas sp. DTU_2021_1001937_2_SI_NGA_ILE_001 TaxID=3077589 RepID=UPI0028FC2A3B|nr:LD-carboxypeptidase [Pseudomonas sp. DTU_2021_1001937_2_SI_NGA_ILE_001]WNW10939.1 LD-carboxypeptidase [Pseudomonas sp. DTU_2021_1001937_2_SI_NGA_ILE_001]
MSLAPAPVLHPSVLSPGDAVALVSPAGPVEPARIEAAAAELENWGLRPKVYPHAFERHSFYAGTDADRLADLNHALADPQIRAVICNRGGYGVQRILGQLDLAAVHRDPKLVVGFSDITALHGLLWAQARLATVHGPVANQLQPGNPYGDGLRQVLMSREPVRLLADREAATGSVRTSGRASGRLLGGNLAILGTCVGTPFMPDLEGAILLLEDVGEAAYRIDRMLTHLGNCGLLQRLAGVAVGDFSVPAGAGGAITPAHVLQERLGGLGIPVLGGLPVGHGQVNQAVPLGTEAVLDADAGTLQVATLFRS